jgi:uncharacterized protein with PIN domain
MDGEHLRAEWRAVSEEIGRELTEWRTAHPKATLAELEQVVYETLSRLQARVLSDLAHASAATDLAATAGAERPRCETCTVALEPRGQQEREVLTPRQAAALRLRRSYAVCPTCGVGLFPPGR